MVAQRTYPEYFAAATTDAANLLSGLRLKYASVIPLSAWKMICNAERKLNEELREYFVPKDEPEQPEVIEL